MRKITFGRPEGALGEFFVRREQQDTMTNRECPKSTNSSGHGKGRVQVDRRFWANIEGLNGHVV